MLRSWKIALIVIAINITAFAHYSCQIYIVGHTRLHNVFLKFLYFPIVLAAHWWGITGGLLVGAICGGIYSIDLFRWWDPTDPFLYAKIAEPLLMVGVGGLLGWMVRAERHAHHAKTKAEERADAEFKRAITDPLTKAFNRRYMDKFLGEMWHDAQDGSGSFAMLMIDLNKFKDINDTYGHAAGDMVLTGLVQAAMKETREHDVIFRTGGDEFVIVLPKTDHKAAVHLAERLRERFSKTDFEVTDSAPFKADCSVGVIEYEPRYPTVHDMMKKLDHAMYQAKKKNLSVALAS